MGFISAQAAIQRKLKPASWLPVIRDFHCEKQAWTFGVPMEEAMDAIWKAAQDLKNEGFHAEELDKANGTMVIDFFTGAKWMDEMVFKFEKVDDKSSKCVVENCSTGFLPLIIPLAPILNIVFCVFPFLDFGKCSAAMRALRKKADSNTGNTIIPKTLKFSLGNPGRAIQKKKEAELAANALSA